MLMVGLALFGLVIVVAMVAVIAIVSTPDLMDGLDWRWLDLLFFWLDWLD